MFSYLSKALLVAAVTQVACQIFKLLFYSVRDRSWSFKYFLSAGGMPSAHSAFVTSLMVSVGMLEGFGTSTFALAAVFGLIVIYDAFRLRGAVQDHAKVLNRLQEKNLPEEERIQLNEMLGHDAAEIAMGVLVALASSVPLTWWLKTF